jgi:hypothetical protein
MHMRYSVAAMIACCLTVLALGCSSSEKTYYAIERAGIVLGYMEVSSTPGDSTTGEPTIERGKMISRLTLLGKGVDVVVEGERGVDPRTGRSLYFDLEDSTGDMIAGATCAFNEDTLARSPSR